MQGDKRAVPTPVFGFHVDGATPSPDQHGQKEIEARGMVGGRSPTLVIIPPSFQVTAQQQQQQTEANTAMASSAQAKYSEDSIRVNRQDGASPDPSNPKPIKQTAESEKFNASRYVGSEGQKSDSEEVSRSSFSTTSELQMSMVAGPTNDGAHSPPSPRLSSRAPKSEPDAQPHFEASSKPLNSQQPGGGADKKKPELTRGERRAIQEAQRAAKAAGQTKGSAPQKAAVPPPGTSKGQEAKPAPGQPAPASKPSMPRNNSDSFRSEASLQSHQAVPFANSEINPSASGNLHSAPKPSKKPVPSLASTELFSHLPQYKVVSVASLLSSGTKGMHPAVLQLGLKLADGSISGANARCMAMLHTLCQVIQDYTTPAGKSLSRDLTQQVNSIITFLVECRPLSVSMGNAIKYLKLKLSKIDPSLPEAEAKEGLISSIAEFIHMRIRLADQEIVNLSVTKVVNGDVVMTYAYSHVVASALLEAASRGQVQFKVLVVDSRPEAEGKLMLQRMIDAGLSCSYVHINAVSYAIREATKVFLGAAAIMSNGTVMGRAGTAAVAMVAHEHRKPVLILCESYKFHERVQLDSITHNELGNPEDLASVPGRPDVCALKQPPSAAVVTDAAPGADGIQSSSSSKLPSLLNLKYDAMPAEFITTIVCEYGMIPPTSVPVILRECNKD